MSARPAGKKPTLAETLAVLEKLHGAPALAERPDDPLIDHLIVAVLGLYADAAKAREAIRALSQAYLDFNELRVSGRAEIMQALEPFVPAEKLAAAAWALRMSLQDVFDGSHGLDLEPLRGREPEDLKHFLTKLPNTPGGPAALVIQMAVGEKHLVLGPPETQLLERLGLLPRAATPLRVRQAVEKLVKPSDRLRFAWLTGSSAKLMLEECDPTQPFGQLLVDSRARELGEREKRRKEEELRRKAEEKRLALEAAKKLKLDAAAAKKREAEERKQAAVDALKRKREEAVKAVQAKKLAERAAHVAKVAEAKALAAKRKKDEAAKAASAKKAQSKLLEAKRKKEAAEAAKKAAAKKKTGKK